MAKQTKIPKYRTQDNHNDWPSGGETTEGKSLTVLGEAHTIPELFARSMGEIPAPYKAGSYDDDADFDFETDQVPFSEIAKMDSTEVAEFAQTAKRNLQRLQDLQYEKEYEEKQMPDVTDDKPETEKQE